MGTVIRSEADVAAETKGTETKSEPKTAAEFNEAERLAYEAMEKAKKKARIAQILDRGILHERLHVDLPPNLVGEWVRADEMEINRLAGIGYWVDDEYATKRALHSDGTSSAKVGDVIFMVTTKENRELIDEVRFEQNVMRHGKPGERAALAKEERDMQEMVRRETGSDVPTIVTPTQHVIRKEDVKRALERSDAQQTPQVRG